jgi:hypothetical protein
MPLTALGVPGSLGTLVFVGLVWAGPPTGIAVAAAVATGVISGSLLLAVRTNAWGVQDWLRRLVRIPTSSDKRRPRLVFSLDQRRGRDKMRTVIEPIVRVTNEGADTATGCRMSMRIKCDALEFEQTGSPFPVEPEEIRDWPLLTDVLIEGDPEMRHEYQLFGVGSILERLLGRELELQAWVDYEAETGLHRFSTPMLYAAFEVEEREAGTVVEFKRVRATTHEREDQE